MPTRYRHAAVVVCGLLVAVWLAPIGSAKEINPSVRLDGTLLKLDSPAILDPESGRTLVPVRALAEPLGYSLTWDAPSRTVRAERPGRQMQFQIGSRQATVNGMPVTLSVAPRLVKGRALIPLRFFAEASGAQVDWNGDAMRIDVISPTSRTAQPESGWTHEQGGPRRTGYNAASTMGAEAAPLWESSVNPVYGNFVSAAVAGDGMVFVSGQDKSLYALDAKTGSVIWQTQTPGDTMAGTPTYDPARKQVYVMASSGKLLALNAATGKQVWFAAIGGGGADDSKYTPVVTGSLVAVHGTALDARTGSKVWNHDTGEVPAAYGARVFGGHVSGYANGMSGLNGGPLWQGYGCCSAGGRFGAMVDGGRVFAAGIDRLAAYDEVSGRLVWERKGMSLAWDTSIASDGERIWAVEKGGINVMSEATGETLRRPAICQNDAATPVINPSMVFVACDGQIYAISRSTYSVTELAAGSGPLALDGDRLYYLKATDKAEGFHLAALQAAN